MTNDNNNPKLILKLDELNDVKFKLLINGSASDPNQTKVVTRFVVTEESSGTSWMFPLARREDDVEDSVFGAVIPRMPNNVFSENKEYSGKVEVIVGGRYFNPTTVGIAFERQMSVETVPMLFPSAQTHNEDVVESVVKPTVAPEVKRPAMLPFAQSMISEAMFAQKKKPAPPTKRASVPSPPVAVKKKVVPVVVDPREKLKNQLKRLIAEAFENDDEDGE